MDSSYALGDTVLLGSSAGVIVAEQIAAAGHFVFETDSGQVQGDVYKCPGPDLPLPGVRVLLIEEMLDGHAQGKYAAMVDDAYWGLRVQPGVFAEAPFTEDFVMGYRLQGRILQSGQPVADANVSLEVTLQTAEDGDVVMWDSEEYNELVYSDALETWVEGPAVLAPIRTDQDGEWEFIAPKGHGAIYQRPGDRIDDSDEAAAASLLRSVTLIQACYCGCKAVVEEGSVAVINLESATLQITGTPGAWVRVSVLDDVGELHQVPPSGTVTLTSRPACEHSIVQLKQNAWGNWDPAWGCPRVIACLEQGETTQTQMPPMEFYGDAGDQIAGRVWERPGVPAAGIDIVIIDFETYEVIGVAATTDGNGLWSASIPQYGFGGDLFVHDPTWGSLPVLGSPYCDIVLGARAYSSWHDEFRPEAWRKGDLGHKNFPYVPGEIRVQDIESGRIFATEELAYGGWITTETLAKYRYVADLATLIDQGPQLRTYAILDSSGALETGFMLGSQPFEEWETPPGLYRASGYCPEMKYLIGAKIHGNVVLDRAARITAAEPEAARMGLEFGEISPYAEMRSGSGGGSCDATSVAGLICPYCGGPGWRDPKPGAAERGYCVQCAVAFGLQEAMDCRTFFRSPTVSANGVRSQRAVTRKRDALVSRKANYHWRPDVYDEAEWFVTQAGAAQPTNAPRWVAKHVDELADGKGFGKFDGDGAPVFTAGHDMSYFGALSQVDRELGVAQLKLAFAAGYETPIPFVVDIDCVLAGGEVETRRVAIPAGLRGPCSETPLGDVVRVSNTPKMSAELTTAPYRGTGLYAGVSDIRLVEPQAAIGCRFAVVADVPFLASPAGIALERRKSTPVALQIDQAWGNPHLCADAVGGIFLAYTADGDIRVHRRGGLADSWDAGTKVTSDGVSDYAWTGKDGRGTLVLVRQSGRSVSTVEISRDDAHSLEE